MPKLNRRQALTTTSLMAAIGLSPARLRGAKVGEDPSIYTRVGGQPFINCTATYTINGGALTRPEVKRAMEEASYWPVNLDELMDKVGAYIAKIMGAESAIVTSGCAAALTHATAGCITGTDPEKMQQLPDLAGLKNEVVVPRQSRNAYDHAVRTVGVKMIEVETLDQLRSALGPRTAMITMLGTGEPNSPIKLEQLASAARPAGVPILVDAAAELPHVPNPYLSRGADLVAYSGGKILRGPQCAGLLMGRKDLVRAAWANSSPHHAFGRMMKVGKEEIMGMVAALEIWRNNYDLKGEYKTWESWLGDIAARVGKLDGVRTEIRPPRGASPFPVLWVEWDAAKTGLTAGEVGDRLLGGSPRIMSHAEGNGHGFQIRPVALKPGESKVVARRLEEILKSAPPGKPKTAPAAPVANLAGAWNVELEFTVGAARHRFELAASGNDLSGRHVGRIAQSGIKGAMDGAAVTLRSSLRYEGQSLPYLFRGRFDSGRITGEVELGEYGTAKFTATRA